MLLCVFFAVSQLHHHTPQLRPHLQFIVCTIDGQVHAIDSASGALLWSTDLPASDRLFTSSASSTLARSSTGAPGAPPSDYIGAPAPATPAPDARAPMLVPGLDGSLFVFAPTTTSSNSNGTGAGTGTGTGPATTALSPAVRRLPLSVADIVARAPFLGPDGALYLGERESVVFTLDAHSGRVAQVLSQKARAGFGTPNGAQGQNDARGASAFRIARNDYVVRAVDPRSSAELWNATLVEFAETDRGALSWGAVGARARAAAGLSLTATPAGGVALLDPRTGQPFWARTLPATVVGAYVLLPDMRLEKIAVHFASAPLDVDNGSGDGNGDGDDTTTSDNTKNRSNSDSNSDSLADRVYVQEFNNQLYVFPLAEDVDISRDEEFNDGTRFLPDGTEQQGQQQQGQQQWQQQNPSPGPYHPPHRPPEYNFSAEEQRAHTISQVLILVLGLASGCFLTAMFWVFLNATQKVKQGAQASGAGDRDKEKSSEGDKKEDEKKENADEDRKTGERGRELTGKEVEEGVVRVGKLRVHTKRILGRGSLGTIVYEGELDDGRPVAVKRMLREYCGMAEREITNLLSCDEHPNLVRYYSREEDATFVYLSLTLCAYSLDDWVEKRKRKAIAAGAFEVTPKLVRLMGEVAAGVAHLHALSIVHRDIKPQNILIDRQGHARISDMGLAKQFEGTHFSYSIGNAGSTGWMAPEIVRLRNSEREVNQQGQEYRKLEHHDGDDEHKEDQEEEDEERRAAITPAMDIFSLGCVFHYMAVGTHPYGERVERDANVLRGRADFRALWAQPVLLNLVQHMTVADPAQRIGAAAVVRHPFFWSAKRRLQFVLDASDRLEVERPTAPLVVEYEAYMARLAELRQWQRRLDPTLLSDLTHHRRYRFDSARDLLRVLRNKSNHYYDLDAAVRATLGPHPDGFFAYFDARFPSLFICTYEFLRFTCAHEPALRDYFCDPSPD